MTTTTTIVPSRRSSLLHVPVRRYCVRMADPSSTHTWLLEVAAEDARDAIERARGESATYAPVDAWPA